MVALLHALRRGQIAVLRVPLQVRRYERAARYHLQMVLPRVIQGRFGELTANSFLPFPQEPSV